MVEKVWGKENKKKTSIGKTRKRSRMRKSIKTYRKQTQKRFKKRIQVKSLSQGLGQIMGP